MSTPSGDAGAGAGGSETGGNQPAGGNGQPGDGGQGGDGGDGGQQPDPAEVAKAAAKRANDEAKNLRTRLRQAEADAQRWQQHQQQNASAEEKTARELAELRTQASSAQRQVLQYQAAAAAGLPLDMAARLQGDDLDALTEDAKALAKLVAPAAPRTPERRRPDPSQGYGQQGSGGGSIPLNGDPIEDMVKSALGIS